MKYSIPFLFFLLLIITSCNQLYRGIPKAPRNKQIVIENNNSVERDISQNNQVVNAEKQVIVLESNVNNNLINSNDDKTSLKTNLIQEKQINSSDINNELIDTLIVDEDVLTKGENMVKIQTGINVAMIFLIPLLLFLLSGLILIILGHINIYRFNQLPYVTKETNDKMQIKKRNFYIAIGVNLFLILLLVALIILVL